ILQLDAILFDSDFEKFKDFSFIGAPWGPEYFINLPFKSKNQHGGNGGFSLRKLSCQLKAFNKLQWLMAYFKIKRLINKRVFILNFFTPSVKFKNLNFINVNEDVLWTQI